LLFVGGCFTLCSLPRSYVSECELATPGDAIELMACALELQCNDLASYCGQHLLRTDAELDGDTLAAVLLVLGDGFASLKASARARTGFGVREADLVSLSSGQAD